MSDSGQQSLAVLRLQTQQRADMINSQFVSVPEWNQMIALSYKEFYDLIVSSYGDMYYMAPAFNFVTDGTNYLYNLPNGTTVTDSISGLVAAPFYKLCGVDLLVTSAQDSWITLRRFEFQERNKNWLANTYNVLGATNLKYKMVGNQLWFSAIPAGGQSLRLWYVPKPTDLQATAIVGTTATSATVTCADTSKLAVGMQVADYAIAAGATACFAAGTTISSIIANTSFVASNAAATTNASYVVAAWNDATVLDGIAGWEEYIILDAAIKAVVKQEDDPAALGAQKAALKQRILDMAPNRDAGQAPTVTDSAALDNYQDTPGWGSGGTW